MNISAACAALIDRWATVAGPDECWLYRLHDFVASAGGRVIYGRVWFEGKRFRAHRLVAKLCGAEIRGLGVCHTCDTPLCLNPSHLFVGTPAANMADKMLKGRHRAPIGEDNGQAKLTNEQAAQVRARAQAGENQRLLAKEFHISQPAVSRLKYSERAYGLGAVV